MAEASLSGTDVALSALGRVEARRSNRIGAHLWVRVGGVDAVARLRAANVSVTGLYIATEEAVGSPGDLVWLSVASQDKARSAQAVARVARVMRQDDRHRGAAVVGAGFELLPFDHPLPDVVALVRHAAQLALSGTGTLVLDRSSTARVRRASGVAIVARPRSLHRDRVILSTSGSLSLDELVRLELSDGTGAELAVDGRVVAVDPDPAGQDGGKEGQRVTMRLDGTALSQAAPPRPAVAAIIDALVAPGRLDSPPPRLQPLSGQLDRVQLSTILSLAESVCLDGIVTLANETTAARIYVAHGRIVDAECDGSDMSASEVVGELLDWTTGEFTISPVEKRRSRAPGENRPSFVEDLRLLVDRHAT